RCTRGRGPGVHRQRHQHPDAEPACQREHDEQCLSAPGSGDGSEAPLGFHPQTSLSAMVSWRLSAPLPAEGLPACAAPIMARLNRLSDACAGRAYAPRVNLHRQTRVAASGGVLLALIGLFLGHTLEYLRVWGAAGIVESITNPVHAYMLPVAGVLVALGAVFAFRLARAWRALNDRLDRAAASVRRALSGRPDGAAGVPAPRSTPGTRLA